MYSLIVSSNTIYVIKGRVLKKIISILVSNFEKHFAIVQR